MLIAIQKSHDQPFPTYLSNRHSPRELVFYLLIRVSLADPLAAECIESETPPTSLSQLSRRIILLNQYHRAFLWARHIWTLALACDSVSFEYSQRIGHREHHRLLKMVCGDPLRVYQGIILAVPFVCGACAGFLRNVRYTCEVIGFHNRVLEFRNPWFRGFAMFPGMSPLIFNTDYWCFCTCPRADPMKQSPGWMLFRRMSIPAICDLRATVLESVAFL
jgi:hypothetical protein